MKDLRVESYNANEVANKRQTITKRAAAAGSAAVLALGLFNLAGTENKSAAQTPLLTTESLSPATTSDGVSGLYVIIDSHRHIIRFHNPTDKAIPLKGLYLSSTADSRQWRMPPMVVRPGGTIEFVTTDYVSTPVLKRMRTNFNLSSRRLTIADAKGVVLARREQCGICGEWNNERSWDFCCYDVAGGSGSWYISITERVA
jgi:hypothetical protein